MGSVVAIFSTNKLLAGGANILTWAIGLWTVWSAIRWIYFNVKSSLSQKITNQWRYVWSNWLDHVKFSTDDGIYFISYCIHKYAIMIFIFIGFSSAIIGITVDENYLSVPSIIKILMVDTILPEKYEIYVLKFFLTIFLFGFQVVLGQVFATSLAVFTRRKRRLKRARRAENLTPSAPNSPAAG